MIFLNLICPSITSQAENESINSLETVNTFYGRWCCTDGVYLYGADIFHPATVIRKTDHGQAWETRGSVNTLDPSFKVEDKIFGTTTPGLIFIPVSKTSVFYLLKSSDGGATFKKVFTFGEGNGTDGANTTNVRLLRGLLELTRDVPAGGGKGTLFIGEYNVSHPRTSGSANDRVRIMKSTDNGDTWTKVVEWNTNGTNQVGHIHAMKQDPYTGEIYICIGDDNSKSGIIKWDGSSDWADNKRMSDISSMSGFRVFTGRQRYRTCDVLFDENYFYTFADTQKPNNPDGTESGIWRGEKDFSSFERMDNQIHAYDPMHIGWFGEKIGNTFIFTTSREYNGTSNAWTQLNTQVYISTDGVHWHATGVLDWRDVGDATQTRYLTNVFTFNDKFYVDCTGGAGHYSSIQCDLSRKWNKTESPVILHPVYYVGNWNSDGNDSNNGLSSDAPKATLNNVLTSNHISAGARVRVSAGTFHEPAIYPYWPSPVLQGRGSVVIEGQGMNETHIIRSSGSSDSYGIKLEKARTLTNSTTPLILKDLEIYLTAEGAADHNNFVLYNIDSYFRTINCRIGNHANDDSPLIKLLNDGSKYASENSYHIANAGSSEYKNIVKSGSGNTSCELKNCIIMNAYDAFGNDYPGAVFSLKNCNFYAIEHAGVLLNSGWTLSPEIKNCIFSCSEAPIINMTSSSDADIDYNLYNKEPVNIAGGEHSLYGSDPMYTDGPNNDFTLLAGSPCKSAGTSLSDVLFDFSGTERNNPPCIGAYESNLSFTPFLSVSPLEITIDAASGHSGEFAVSSNTFWNASDTSDWISLSVSKGSGNSTVIFSADSANRSVNERTANITFSSATAAPVVVKVIQSGAQPFLLISPSSINIDSISGATGEFTVNSNTSWSVSDDADWLNLSSSTGSGNGTLTVISCNANTTILSRTATLTFSADGVSAATLTVIQTGQSPFLTIAPSSVTLSAQAESTAEFAVSSNTGWTVSDNADWLNLSSSSGSGNGTLTVISGNANTTILSRTATLTFSADGVSAATLTVIQLGQIPFLTIAPSSVTLSAESEATAEFTVSSNSGWTVTDNAEWLSLSSSSGSGTATIVVKAGSINTSAAARTANVTFSADNVSPVTVNVIQQGQAPFLKVTPSSLTINALADATGEFTVSSNTTWTLSDNAEWLSLSSSSGSVNATITVKAKSSNNSKNSRNANVTFSANGTKNVIVKVIQSGTRVPRSEITGVRIFPNPVSDILSVECEYDIFKSLRLYNSQGELIKKETITGPVQNIDFSGYKHGLYILEFRGDSGKCERLKVISY